MKKKTKIVKNKALLIGGGVLSLFIIGGLAYYFLVYTKKNEAEKKQEDTDAKKVDDTEIQKTASLPVYKAGQASKQANRDAYLLLQKLNSTLALKKRKSAILAKNGGSMNQNALNNQIIFDNAKKIKEETGVEVFIKPADETKGNTVYAM